MALWHIISVFRNMTFSHLAARSLDAGRFNEAHYDLPSRSQNPRGNSLGIIGLGDIGLAIAKKVHLALGMKILYNDIQRKSTSQENEVDAAFYPDLEEMLGQSDCVLVATPFSGSTLITAELLAKFKPGSRLVNIARGSLVDENALADALERKHLSGAGLDVHASEPNVNPRLANNPQVGMTSHTGGGALETWINFEKLAMENVERVLTGREALTPVNGHLIKQKERDVQVNGHLSADDSAVGSSDDATTGNLALHRNQPSADHSDPNRHHYNTAHSGANGTMHHQSSTNGDIGGACTMELSGKMHQQTSIIGGV